MEHPRGDDLIPGISYSNISTRYKQVSAGVAQSVAKMDQPKFHLNLPSRPGTVPLLGPLSPFSCRHVNVQRSPDVCLCFHPTKETLHFLPGFL